MIVTSIRGGLGNQLFQYAFGRRLSLDHNTELCFDLTEYKKNWYRSFKLDKFNLPSYKILKRRKSNLQLKSIVQTDLNWDERLLNLQDNTHLYGFWQSYKYFDKYSDIIRNDLKLATQLDSKSNDILSHIRESNSVSLHIRRGDYVSLQQYKSMFEILRQSYYNNALVEILKYTTTPTLFIFSDDIEWVKANLKFDFPAVYIEHTYSRKHSNLDNYTLYKLFSKLILQNTLKDDAHIDLILMSNCKYNVIANSTLSWWAAWLNSHRQEYVYAPSKWYEAKNANGSFVPDSLYPDAWNIISVY